MARIKHYAQLIVLDTLAVICMIAAILTGWLPGPGGIPLFIVGLSLLAVNHEWARKYIDMLRDYADRLGDLIFLPKLRLFFDILAPALIVTGIILVVYNTSLLMLSAGIFGIALGLLLILGNRDRWKRIKQKFLNKT